MGKKYTVTWKEFAGEDPEFMRLHPGIPFVPMKNNKFTIKRRYQSGLGGGPRFHPRFRHANYQVSGETVHCAYPCRSEEEAQDVIKHLSTWGDDIERSIRIVKPSKQRIRVKKETMLDRAINVVKNR